MRKVMPQGDCEWCHGRMWTRVRGLAAKLTFYARSGATVERVAGDVIKLCANCEHSLPESVLAKLQPETEVDHAD
jgi:hypothetical protein